jgi:hypothetical protein
MFTADNIVTAVNNANARLEAAGLQPFAQQDLEDFLARSMAQMIAVGADAAALKARADASAATAAAEQEAQGFANQAIAVRAKITTV